MKKQTETTALISEISMPQQNKDSAVEGYFFIEEVESHIHLDLRTRLYKRITSLYTRLNTHGVIKTEKNVTIFIASGDHIDKKIEMINKRLNKE